MGMNLHIVNGNLGQDPDIRTLPGGSTVANFSVGVTDRYTTKDGEKKEKTEWVRCTAFGKQAEFVGNWFKKGDGINVIGRTETREYQNKEGGKCYGTSTVCTQVSFPSGGKGKANVQQDNGQEQGNAAPESNAPIDDDDIPF